MWAESQLFVKWQLMHITVTATISNKWGNTHKYVWLELPDQPDFFSKIQVEGSASIKTEK